MQSFAALSRMIRRFFVDRRGNVAVATALAATSLMGFIGLGTEATMWYTAKRDMQGATDAAAYSAGIALANGQSSTSIANIAKAVAAQYGFTNGTDGVTVTVSNPPTSGGYASNANAVEVVISQPQSLIFSSYLSVASPTVSANAVSLASSVPSGAADCVVALDKGKVIDVDDSGGAVLNLSSCGLAINSDASDALDLSGGAQVKALSVSIVGGDTVSGGASITATDGVTTGAAVTPNPYASLSIPSYSGCNQTSLSVAGGAVKSYSATGSTPYVFCNGLSISGGANVTLNPGVYVITGSSGLSVSGGATLTGSGVTIILTGSSSANIGSASFSGGTTVTLSAPTNGATAGMAIWQDPNAASSGSNSFSGGASMNVTGVVYFPNQAVSFSGGSSTSGAKCTQVIGYTLNFSGGTNLSGNCKGTGVSGMGSNSSPGTVALVQ